MDDVTPSLGAPPLPILFAAGESSPLYYYLGLAALVGAAIWAGMLAYSSWLEAHEELDPATPAELLDAFERARAQGDLSEEELANLRRRINKSG